MVIVLPGNVLLNVAHVSVVSGVQELKDGSGRHAIRLLIMGNHWHNTAGAPEEIAQLHARLQSEISKAASG